MPVPEKVEQALLEAEVDLATMRAIMAHWVSPEQFSNGDMDDEAALMTKYEHPGVGAEEGTVKAEMGKFFRERILSEYCRVQQLTNGNRNEVWRRRCEGVMKGFKAYFETVKTEAQEEPEGKSVTAAAVDDNDEPTDPEVEVKGPTESLDLEEDELELPKSPETSIRLARSCIMELLCMNLFCPEKKEDDEEDMKLDLNTQKNSTKACYEPR